LRRLVRIAAAATALLLGVIARARESNAAGALSLLGRNIAEGAVARRLQ